MNRINLSESILVEINKSNVVNLYDLFDKKANSEEATGKNFDDICRDVANDIISGVETAKVANINLDKDGASLYIVTNNGFAAWFDYYLDNSSIEVEGDLPENDLQGDWNAYIFHTDDPVDLITKYVQEDDDVFMTMESEGRNYLIDNGYIVETPIKRTNGMEVSHYEWKDTNNINESDSNNLYIDLDKLINLSNKYLDSNNINGKFYIDSDNKIRLELNNDSVDKWMNLNESSKEESLKDNYTASSIASVLNSEDDDYAIKIENRTTNKSTKWLNIKGHLLFDLWGSTTDMNSDNINKFKEN